MRHDPKVNVADASPISNIQRLILMTNFFRNLFLLTILPLSMVYAAGSDNEIKADDKTTDAKTETIVLIHGLGRSNTAMWLMAKRFKKAGYNVQRVGYDSLGQTPDQIQEEVSKQINDCCTQMTKPVHFVGHSLGGLMIRAYLGSNEVENLGKVVLIGSPNSGTPVVDIHKDKWWMKLAGETASALGTESGGFPKSLPKPTYPLGIIAGIVESSPLSDAIPGDDDGMVPVDSTRVEGMSDFIVVPTSHSMMRYNRAVFNETISFLRSGKFGVVQP